MAPASLYSDLELRLQPVGDGRYAVAVRFTPANIPSIVNLLGVTTPEIQLDAASLLELSLDPQAYSRRLSDACFADARLRAACALAYARAGDTPLRLRLYLDPQDELLQPIHWELLRYPTDGGEVAVATSERIIFSRSLSTSVIPAAARGGRAGLRALVVLASPDDLATYQLDPIDTAAEEAQILDALEPLPTAILASHRPGQRPTLANVRERLGASPDIVYICCHGAFQDGQAYLWLEGEHGHAEPVAASRLIDSIADQGRGPLLVILASCHSAGREGQEARAAAALGPQLVTQAGVLAVIAMQDTISVATNTAFMRAFLTDIRRDGMIDRAVAAARGAVLHREDWWHPVLLMHVRDGLLWNPPPIGEEAYHVEGLANPYLGLKAYGYSHQRAYAGREPLIARAVEQVSEPGNECSLLFVTGASGSGKSSFALAGLVPALEHYYRKRDVEVRWAEFRPLRRPLAALADALRQLGVRFTSGTAPDEEVTAIEGAPAGPGAHVSLLVIDQFEELFTQSQPAQREGMLTLLERLPSFAELRAHIIVTLRNDYVPELFERKILYDLVKAGVELRAMSDEELKRAIEEPIFYRHPASGKRIAGELLRALVRDAAHDPGSLPLLQVTLERLWDGGRLAPDAYGQLTDAIRQQAEEFLCYSAGPGSSARPESEQDELMAILVALVRVSPDDEARRDVRVRRTADELEADSPRQRALLESLVRARLLSASTETRDGVPAEVFDIIHESLIHNWGRFQTAISQQRKRIQMSQRFEVALEQWNGRGNDPRHKAEGDELFVLQGLPLEEARELARLRDIATRRPGADQFLQASLKAREDERQRELDQAKALASEQRRRINVLRGSLLALAILLGALGWLAITAIAQLQRASAQRLALFAQAQESAPETGLLLAYEAVDRDPTLLTERVFRAALERATWRPTVLSGHQGAVLTVAFSPDGQTVITGSADGSARVWGLDGGAQRMLEGHSGPVRQVVVSPDGQLIATGSEDRSVRLWQLDGTPVATLAVGDKQVSTLVFRPDSSALFAADESGAAGLWDRQGRLLVRFAGQPAKVRAAAFSPDGQIVTAAADGRGRVWADDGRLLSVLEGHSGPLTSVAADQQGRLIATGSEDGTIRLWTADGALVPGGELREAMGVVSAVVFSPDGRFLVSAGARGGATLWQVDTRRPTPLSSHSGAITAVAFDATGSRFLTASADGTARVWEVRRILSTDLNNVWDGKPQAILQGHTAGLNAAAFSPDAKRIVTASSDGLARLWLETGPPLPLLRNHNDDVYAVAFSPDGQNILTASGDTTARLWDLNGHELRAFEVRGGSAIRGLAFSPDGALLATSSDDGIVRVWTAADASQPPVPLASPRNLALTRSVAFGTDAGRQTVIAGYDNGWVRLWQRDPARPTWSLVHELKGHIGAVTSVSFSPDGTRFATGSLDRTVRVWRSDGTQETVLSGFLVQSVSFSPDGTRILSAGNKSAQLWSLEENQDGTLDGTLLTTFEQGGHTKAGVRAAFSADGQRIITVSQDDLALVWDQQGALATIITLPSGAWAVAAHPKENRIAVALVDWTARQYALELGDPVALTRERVGRALTSEECETFGISLLNPLRLTQAR